MGIPLVMDEISFQNFFEALMGCWYTGTLVCLSAYNWLTSLLKIDKYWDISSSG